MATEGDIPSVAAMANTGESELGSQAHPAPIASQSPHGEAESVQEKKRKHDDGNEAATDHRDGKDGNFNQHRDTKRNKKAGFGSKGHGSRDKRKDLGRGEYFRNRPDKRGRNEMEQAKLKEQELDGAPNRRSVLPKPFTEEEIAQEERKPKKKVAVLIGYSGSGYKGMQISTTEKTIEGDLFTAFVKAGAISKANATDPKKSSLVRCARTDKGVHAAGNIISLKLIVEDADIVKKINEHLSPQIRVWGIERTIGSFSCYQQCDSRWYEYLLPTHSLIPPHPSSFLGRKLVELAEQAGDGAGYSERQADVANFWDEVEEQKIKPLLNTYSENMQALLRQALYEADAWDPQKGQAKVEDADMKTNDVNDIPSAEAEATTALNQDAVMATAESGTQDAVDKRTLDDAIKAFRSVYLASKKSYRVSKYRLDRLREILGGYVGTQRFHNYTVKMSYRDSSAKRHIKSFTVSEPFERDGTEWVSLKVHGQSFMMHQIRKMVGMAANMVRCGTSTDRLKDSFQDVEISIAKAPGLGLLLERPVFTTYNKRVEDKFPDKEQIDFGKWETEMEEFKQREIYGRIFREEESMNQFHGYFANIDTTKDNTFLYFTSMGMEASKRTKGQDAKNAAMVDASDDEDVEDGEG